MKNRTKAKRAFALTFGVTLLLFFGFGAGLVAAYRTRRVCDGRRAESAYVRLAEEIRPAFPSEPAALMPPAATEPERRVWLPYPLRLLRAIGEAWEPSR